ncbi:MAG: DUF2975 domain-containing protein [Clostridium sp.]
MNKNLKIQKSLLVLDIVLMVVATIFSIWMVLHNEPTLNEGEMIILSTKLQIKFIIMILASFLTISYPLLLMIKVINNIGTTRVFAKENIKLMERAGAFLGVYALLYMIGFSVDFSTKMGYGETLIKDGVLENISGFSLNFSMAAIAIMSVISIIVVIVEIIKEGIKIKEENELTV